MPNVKKYEDSKFTEKEESDEESDYFDESKDIQDAKNEQKIFQNSQ